MHITCTKHTLRIDILTKTPDSRVDSPEWVKATYVGIGMYFEDYIKFDDAPGRSTQETSRSMSSLPRVDLP